MTQTGRRVVVSLGVGAAILVSLLWSGPQCHHATGVEPATSDRSTSRSLEDSLRGRAARGAADSTPLVHPVIVDSARTAASPRPSLPPPSGKLIIPVQGIRATELTDTYTAARSGGRKHDAIDIMAGHNTPVLATADGTIRKLFLSKLGGITIYQLSADGHTVYYYAHLDHYAPGLVEGVQVRQGQVIGYVGDTGDAGPGNYHLHFGIWRITDPKNYWDGENVNPYPILLQASQ